MLVLKILFLLLLANGTPVVAKRVLAKRMAYPLDGGKLFFDGRPWFGSSKTIRGIVLSIVFTSFGAVIIGYSLMTGAIFASASLVGDLVSSFIKRRIGLPSSSKAVGLDQIPESLLPILVCWQALELDLVTAAVVMVIFLFGELLLSRILFRLHIRDRPY